MTLSLTLIGGLAALGVFAGFMAGLFGIGGGMLLVPFLTWIIAHQGVAPELSVKMAIASSMATIMFTSISSALAHHRRGAVRWDLVQGIAPGIVVGGLVCSAGIFAALHGNTLAILFTVFVGFSAVQMFRNTRPKPSRQMPGRAGQFAAGGAIGLISGLVGAGGGFISVPFMVWCNVVMHQAVATSAALGFPIALANVAGYAMAGWNVQGLLPWSLGYVWVPGVIPTVVFSMMTAPLGARMSHRWNVQKLKRAFAIFLLIQAFYMLWKVLFS